MTTLVDVAKRANVSKMTVSRVINHPEKVTLSSFAFWKISIQPSRTI